MEIIIITFISIILAQLTWDLIVEFFKVFKTLTCDSKEKEMSDTYVTLDEFYNEDHKAIKQVVYKVEGNFNGNISGDNVTVILMGDGSINGDVKAKDGEVVLIKGNINGDVKANKIVCPSPDDTKKQKHEINIKSYSVILPMYVKHSGYITVPIRLEFTDNGELIAIRQIEK